MKLQGSLLTATWMDLSLEAGADDHPNSMKFKGTLLVCDEASTKPPNGSNGHRIMIPRALAEKRLKTLEGMGVNFSEDLSSHAPTHKVGVIKKAWLEGNELKVSGVIWKKDFPKAEEMFGKHKLGMSFEGSQVSVEDQKAPIWKLTDVMFTGASILHKTAAAYFKTEAIAASAMFAQLVKEDGSKGVDMAEQTKKKKTVAASGDLNAANKAIAKMFAEAIQPIVSVLTVQASATQGVQALLNEQSTLLTQMIANGNMAASTEDEDDIDASGDDEDDDVDAAAKKASMTRVKAAKKKAKASDDDDDMDDDEDDDDDDVDAAARKSLADDTDGLEDLVEDGDMGDADDDEALGAIHKNIKNQGSKTTVTNNPKNKNVAASGDTKLRDMVIRQSAALKASQARTKKLEKQVRTLTASAQAAAEATDRRSHSLSASAMSPQLAGLLAKNQLDGTSLSASGEKLDISEFDGMLDAAGPSLSAVARMAIKTEAHKHGLLA